MTEVTGLGLKVSTGDGRSSHCGPADNLVTASRRLKNGHMGKSPKVSEKAVTFQA